MRIRELNRNEWQEVARMIHASTNAWYQSNLNRSIFDEDDFSGCLIFPEVYEALDPNCCLVAEDDDGSMMGSCFYHPRETHVSLGIMNAHPDHAGRGVAGMLLAEVVRRAGGLPVRLVSSCMNLDSFSLYTRARFSPGELYQDMYIPSEKALPETPAGGERVREASMDDVEAMVELEEELNGIRRAKDFRFFISNEQKIWRALVLEGDNQKVDGFLCSVSHPGSKMLGPGVMRSEADALALIHAQLVGFGDRQPVFLVPARAAGLVSSLYQWGARNCELHVAQARGAVTPPCGITMPTFMPETS
ncbi:MAG: GNAT family N-acetyltransferase [Roseibacillus sp.]|nr:GNAT family N-acetyltransferase [Roseibacillus sp.]